MDTEEISKRVIVVLLILTMVVSILGTLIVLDSLSGPMVPAGPGQQQSSVQLHLLKYVVPTKKITDSDSAVSIHILPAE